jgi:hypothetical protein
LISFHTHAIVRLLTIKTAALTWTIPESPFAGPMLGVSVAYELSDATLAVKKIRKKRIS